MPQIQRLDGRFPFKSASELLDIKRNHHKHPAGLSNCLLKALLITFVFLLRYPQSGCSILPTCFFASFLFSYPRVFTIGFVLSLVLIPHM
jgi:hypothetical protein